MPVGIVVCPFPLLPQQVTASDAVMEHACVPAAPMEIDLAPLARDADTEVGPVKAKPNITCV